MTLGPTGGSTPGSGPTRVRRDGLGLALRPQHVAELARALDEGRPTGVDFVEIVSENHLRSQALASVRLAPIARALPVVLHGVSLDLLGPGALDLQYLASLRTLAHSVSAPFFTDHLAWCASGGLSHHDLLPAPCAHELVAYAVARIRAVEDAVGLPFGIENISSYLELEPREMPEWEMLARVAEGANCGIVLDVNNVFVTAQNHGFDPRAYLAGVPWERVLYVHMAGHQPRPDGLLHDTHDRAVADEVLALYADAWRRGGPFPTVLEWDDEIPSFAAMLAELSRIARAREDG